MIAEYLHKKRLSIISKYCSNVEVDIGCGKFPKGKITIDIDPKVKPTIIANLYNLPLKDNSINSLLCSHLIEHLNNLDKTIGEIERVLKNRGCAIFLFPNDNSILWNLIKPFWSIYYKIAIDKEASPDTHIISSQKILTYLSKHFKIFEYGWLNLKMEIFVYVSKHE